MKKSYTDITVVLDRSGSMEMIREDTMGGFNTFLADQQKVPGEATITLVQFDDRYEVNYEGIVLKEAKALTPETYAPRGSTALLDAWGRAMISTGDRLKTMKESERPEKVIFVVQTDGYENASKEFSRTQVYDAVKHQREVYKWEFVFLGANQDAIAVGESLGVLGTHSMTYAHNSMGATAAFASSSKNVADYRTGKKKDMSYTEEDRKKQKKAGA
jgi:hypothetical protein